MCLIAVKSSRWYWAKLGQLEAKNIIAHNLHTQKVKSFKLGCGGTRGNVGTGVRVSILKPTPIIYPAFEKKHILFIYLISQNVDIFIYCSLIYIPFRILCNCVCGGGKLRVILVRVWESVFWAIWIPKIRPFIYFLFFLKKGGLSNT